MKTVFRAVVDHETPGGFKYRYESHDCATQGEAQTKADLMGGVTEVHQLDFNERTGRVLSRVKVA